MNSLNNTKDLKMLKESYLMYERSKQQTIERLNEAMNADGSKRFSQDEIEEKTRMLTEMQNEIATKYAMAGGDVKDLDEITVDSYQPTPKREAISAKKTILKKKTDSSSKRKPIVKTKKEDVPEYDEIPENTQKIETVVKDNVQNHTQKSPVSVQNAEHYSNPWKERDYSELFDVIPLPSKGQCYENGMSTIAVSYLTANDENMIVSPNLYRDGLIMDYLLEAKIRDKKINPDDLLEGDRDAIILWLRATGYGTEYPVTVTDNKTGINFDTTVDLTQIKHKPFVLEGDENGYFDFTLPNSKDEIKFRFLTHGDIKLIEQLDEEEQSTVKKERLFSIVEEIERFMENDDTLGKDDKTKLYEAKRNIKKWADGIEATDEGYTHKLTNRLELSIVSVNGEDDREYIADYVQSMNAGDALALRRYISENEPGLDFAVTVERPESLGGGSMPVFLSVDEYFFLNIAR